LNTPSPVKTEVLCHSLDSLPSQFLIIELRRDKYIRLENDRETRKKVEKEGKKTEQ
jgi:hypothetical protein